jgi:AcrR family transcriptional regulator
MQSSAGEHLDGHGHPEGREHSDGHTTKGASSQVADIQRARILAAMVDVVSEHGAANVTVAHIVSRSGVSRRTFYELFAGREDCFLAAFDQAIARIAAVVVPAFEEERSWRAKIRAALSVLLECLESDPCTGRLLVVETLGAGLKALERRRGLLLQIRSFVDQGRSEGKRGDGPPPLTAEGVIGGVLSVLHSRLLDPEPGSLLGLAGPLTSMVVLPYLGQAAAQKELVRPVPEVHAQPRASSADPLRDVNMRLTYRTVRVLMAVAEHPAASNRNVGVASGMNDQGQISKLLSRLHRLGLIHNTGIGPKKGAPNAWTLTPKGQNIHATIRTQTS